MTDESTTRQRSRSRFWLSALLGTVALATVVDAAFAQPRQTPACIQFWPEVRYQNYAYDHIVHLLNACETQAICLVSSDIVPTPVKVVVPNGEETAVLILRGSPAREFTPHVECGLVL